MDRQYLYVAPEDYAEVRAAGACWDDASKRWYLPEGTTPAGWTRWLGEAADDVEFGLESAAAWVASGEITCASCAGGTRVICVHCDSGIEVEGGPLGPFTVSHLWAMDEALAGGLAAWPSYRRGADGADGADGGFVNHCERCGAVVEEYRLHAEPGDVFFDVVAGVAAGVVKLTRIEGRVRMSGDVSYGV